MPNVHSRGLAPSTEKPSKKAVPWLFTAPIARKPCYPALMTKFSGVLVGTALWQKRDCKGRDTKA